MKIKRASQRLRCATMTGTARCKPLVSKMLQADGVTAGSVLLVDSVNNRILMGR